MQGRAAERVQIGRERDRRRLFGGAKKEAAPDPRDYQLREQDGEIRVLTASGRAVSDDEARRVRRTEWFKDAQAEYNRERIQEVNAETEAVESVIRLARRVPAQGAIEPEARVEEKFDAFIGNLELPLEFNAQYSYDVSTGDIMIDLDLPEIEDLPGEKAVELASGAVRIKPKTIAEKREMYSKCVLGLAVLFADGAFLASAGVRRALVSGYTQRRNARTGELEDQYVFSIAFARVEFANARFDRVEPETFVEAFRNRMNPSGAGELKTIPPYTAEEFAAMAEERA